MSYRAEILQKFSQLPEQEQVELLDDLLLSAPHLDQAFSKELERRCREAEDHPEAMIPEAEFLAELRRIDD